MKKYKKTISIIIFFIGISLLLYPTIGNIINSYRQQKVLNSYVEKINTLDSSYYDEMYEKAASYNEKVFLKQKANSRYDLKDEYDNVLRINDTNVMGYIEIPKANIKLPIYHGVSDSVLQKGVGHVRESSLPIGTENQNSLLMGHTGLPTSKIFTNLGKLEIGDYFIITVLNNKLYYKIYDIEVITPDELIDRLPVQEGRDLVTLVTCTPYGVNSHRLVLHAERCEEIIENDHNETSSSYLIIISVIAILLLASIISYLVIRKRKQQADIASEKITSVKTVNKNNNKTTSNKKKTTKKKTTKKGTEKNTNKTAKKNNLDKPINSNITDDKSSIKTPNKSKKKKNNQKKKRKKKQKKNNAKKK